MTLIPLSIALLWGCPPPSSDDVEETGETGETGIETDADTDADSDSDTDADTDSDTDTDTEEPQTTAVIVSTDYSVGTLNTLSLSDWTLTEGITDTYADSAIVIDDGTAVLLERLGKDSVSVYTPGSWDSPRTQFSVGDNGNPNDAVVCGDKLFVSLYGGTSVGIYDPTSGTLTGAVDLSAFDDGDGYPEIADLVEMGGMIYVAMNQLDQTSNWVAGGEGTVAAIGCDGTLGSSWAVGPNPSISAWPGYEDRLVVRTGVWGAYDDDGSYLGADFDGTVYALDVGTDTAGATQFDEATAQANLYSMRMGRDNKGVALTNNADYTYSIHCVDAGAETWTFTEVANGYDYYTTSAISDANEAFVGVSVYGVGGGLEVLDLADCSMKTSEGMIETALYPNSIAFH